MAVPLTPTLDRKRLVIARWGALKRNGKPVTPGEVLRLYKAKNGLQ